jgi:hypothetical protein
MICGAVSKGRLLCLYGHYYSSIVDQYVETCLLGCKSRRSCLDRAKIHHVELQYSEVEVFIWCRLFHALDGCTDSVCRATRDIDTGIVQREMKSRFVANTRVS